MADLLTKTQMIALINGMSATKYTKFAKEFRDDIAARRAKRIKNKMPDRIRLGSHVTEVGAEPAHTAEFFTTMKNSQYVRDLNQHCTDLKELFVFAHGKGLYPSADYSFIPTPGTNPTQGNSG